MADEQLPSDEWLEQANATLAGQGEIPKRRPLKALGMWAMETQQSLALGSSAHTHITAWFERSTSYDRDARQPAGRSAFFWDLTFFAVRMPIPFGSPEFDPFSLFEKTPNDVVIRIKGAEQSRKEFLDHFMNAFGVFLSRLDLSSYFDLNPSLTGQLMAAAYQHLSSATSILLDATPNSKALQDARMAVEIALKAVLTSKLGHTDATLKKEFGHRLDKLHATLTTVVPDPGFTLAELNVFPDIHARYSDNPASPATLWEGYALANRILAIAFAVIGDEIQSSR